jgi:carbohydrate kinase (thermoresistant glucokinase family)
MHEHIATLIRRGENAVLTCSALKRAYRRQIVGTLKQVHFVYLRGSFDLIQSRLAARQGHFMPSDLLASQFDTLEEPEHAVTVDVTYTPAEIVEHIRQALALPRGTA